MSRLEILPLAAVARAGATCAVQQVMLPGTWSFGEHGHRAFGELIYVESGTVDHRCNGLPPRSLPAGSVVLIRERDRHALAAQGLRYWNLIIPTAEWLRLAAYLDEPQLCAVLESAPEPPSLRLQPRSRARMLAGLERLFRLQNGPGCRRALASFAMEWLPLLAAALPNSNVAHNNRGATPLTPNPGIPWLPELLRLIDERLDKGLRAAQLPRLAGVSAAHLSRSFQRHLACSPSAWLTRQRIERAALLLTHSDRDLLDIALGLGFASLSWFHRSFRQVHGLTPAVYRQRYGLSPAGRHQNG